MITSFIAKKLSQAKYKMLDDGSYFGEIPGLQGVWASDKNLEKCREELRVVLEEWLILKLKDNDKIPGLQPVKIKYQQPVGLPKVQYA